MTLDYLVSLELIRLTLMRARKGPARDHIRTNGRLMISHEPWSKLCRSACNHPPSTHSLRIGLMLRQLSSAPEFQP